MQPTFYNFREVIRQSLKVNRIKLLTTTIQASTMLMTVMISMTTLRTIMIAKKWTMQTQRVMTSKWTSNSTTINRAKAKKALSNRRRASQCRRQNRTNQQVYQHKTPARVHPRYSTKSNIMTTQTALATAVAPKNKLLLSETYNILVYINID